MQEDLDKLKTDKRKAFFSCWAQSAHGSHCHQISLTPKACQTWSSLDICTDSKIQGVILV